MGAFDRVRQPLITRPQVIDLNAIRTGTEMKHDSVGLMEHYGIRTTRFGFGVNHKIQVPRAFVFGPITNEQFQSGVTIILPYEETSKGYEKFYQTPLYHAAKAQSEVDKLTKRVTELMAVDIHHPAQWAELLKQLTEISRTIAPMSMNRGW